jgi:hypothetical protein
VKDRSKCCKGCDCTGIGAIARLRHGCYAPGAMVDFQKRERQMNIDYALCEALANTHTQDAPHCIFVYDINCQYITNLRTRIAAGEFLKISNNLFFIPGIGLFHVHGRSLHSPTCSDQRRSAPISKGSALIRIMHMSFSSHFGWKSTQQWLTQHHSVLISTDQSAQR